MTARRAASTRLMLAILILGLCIGCDQTTKTIATQTLRNTPPQSYAADTIRFEYALNPGGFLSLGGNLPPIWRKWIFIGFNSCLMLALGVFLLVKRDAPLALFVATTFVIAGGIGNLIDRVANQGLVTDFLNVGIGPLRTGVFNVADIAVTFGVIGMACISFARRPADKT